MPQPMAIKRAAFTLVELLISIAIIAILTMMLVVALANAREEARLSRTKSQIAKINELLMVRWESYSSRRVPVRIPQGASGKAVANLRLLAIRELMRMEMPDRISDVEDPPVVPQGSPQARPSLSRAYLRRVAASGGFANWKASNTYASAECLYMILASMQDANGNGLDYFPPDEIGDVDNDGMPEVLDAWGTPISFLRWAPGLSLPGTGNSTPLQSGDASKTPDSFDSFKADPRWADPDPLKHPFALHPLIYSAGPDKIAGITSDNSSGTPHQYSQTQYTFPPPSGTTINWPNDPYSALTSGPYIGMRANGSEDNVDNHFGVNQ